MSVLGKTVPLDELLLPDYGNARHLRPLWELKNGYSHAVIPIVIFAKARQITGTRGLAEGRNSHVQVVWLTLHDVPQGPVLNVQSAPPPAFCAISLGLTEQTR
jgi:hypothetical protein